jgi:transcriptional regulator with XRE-family HTH domain
VSQREQEVDKLLRVTLKMLRQRKGLNTVAMAKAMKTNHSVICRIENGGRRIDVVTLMRWCRVVREPAPKVLRFVLISGAKSHKRKD